MFGTHDLPLFIVSGLLLNLMPGPDSLLIATRSASQGWRAGSVAALGVGAGTFVHVFAAALGLSAVLATSASAFGVIKYLGAAYLVYVGLRLLLAGRTAGGAVQAAPASALRHRAIFAQGFLTNLLNPKVALFFLAFVPQFIDPASSSKALAFVALGCIFNANSMLWGHALVFFTAAARRRVRLAEPVTRWLNRMVGTIFVSFGVKLALSGRG